MFFRGWRTVFYSDQDRHWIVVGTLPAILSVLIVIGLHANISANAPPPFAESGIYGWAIISAMVALVPAILWMSSMLRGNQGVMLKHSAHKKAIPKDGLVLVSVVLVKMGRRRLESP